MKRARPVTVIIRNMVVSPELYYCGCIYDEEGGFYDDEGSSVETIGDGEEG